MPFSAILRCFIFSHALAVASVTAAPKEENADIVVYGGTPSGIAAVCEASAQGRSVILIVPEKFLGGMMTGGLGASDKGVTWTVGGLARAFFEDVNKHYEASEVWTRETRAEYLPKHGQTHTEAMKCQWYFEPHVAGIIFEKWLTASKARVLRNERLHRSPGGVTKEQGVIQKITLESGLTVRGKYFIDATYEGDLMAAAGVTFTIGREPNAAYGETMNGIQLEEADVSDISPWIEADRPKSGLLPRIEPKPFGPHGTGDHRFQAYNFRLCLTAVPENRVPIAKPAGYNPLNYELMLRDLQRKKSIKPDKGYFTRVPMPNLKTDSNNTGQFSTDYIGGNYTWPEATYAEREKILEDHRSYVQGFFWFLGNDPRVPESLRREVSRWGLARDEFTDNGHWPTQLYVREARRMIGEHVMNENNFPLKTTGADGKKTAANAVAPVKDIIAVGSYALDSHKVGMFVNEEGKLVWEGGFYRGVMPYGISYRSILPKEAQCKNLLVSVCVSATHVAYGSMRMESVFMELGQAAAAAASIALKSKATPHALPYPVLAAHLKARGAVLDPTVPAKNNVQPKMAAKEAEPSSLGAAIDRLHAAGILSEPDYWNAHATAGAKCDGAKVAALMITAARRNQVRAATIDFETALKMLASRKLIGGTEYWQTHAVPGKECSGGWMATFITRLAGSL